MIDGKELTISTGKLAPQAHGSVLVEYGENALLCTTVMDRNPREGTDFLPLTIDFRESYAAGGKIGGAAYRRREGRPGDACTLYGRLTDRALRPLFPKGMINGIVVAITPLALDHTQDLGMMSLIGASVSVLLSGIPFKGPVGAVRIGRQDGNFIINPTLEQLKTSELNLICAGREGSINMIECDAKQAPEAIVNEWFVIAQQFIDQTVQIQNDFLTHCTVKAQTVTFNKPSASTIAFVHGLFTSEIQTEMFGNTKISFNEHYGTFEKHAIAVAGDHRQTITDPSMMDDYSDAKIKMAVFDVVKYAIRDRTLNEGKRADNRSTLDIRPIDIEVALTKRNHGTGMFRRGDTQVLSTVTLGSPSENLIIDSMEESQVEQYYMHHYNFPAFSTGEARGSMSTSRREIGHGKLAEKALEQVLPSREAFPYTIRVVSDCLGSGWSTSMWSVCGSTLALYDAWVPLIAPVSGAAMWLMTKTDDEGHILSHKVLTDISGTEDFVGDMDFKVAGTTTGITAIQLDTKVMGITVDIVHETIADARVARLRILDKMLETISAPRASLSPYAPKLVVMMIDPDKIKSVIGKWGEMINKIIELSWGVKIDFEDDGKCFISHTDQDKIDKAIELIKDITEDLPLNTPLDGVVSRVEDYGLFVNLPRKKSGLIHVSQLNSPMGTSLAASYKIGQTLKVMVIGADDQGRLKLKKVA